MEKSSELNELFKALSIAQGQIKGAKADSENPFFKSKYADLESVWSAIRKPLTDNNLTVIQCVNDSFLTTVLGHSSGQYISSNYPLTPKDQSPQAIGSATSYARRYSLAAMIGVYQIDDDAEAAQPRPIKPQYKKEVDNQIEKQIERFPNKENLKVSKEQAEFIYQTGYKFGFTKEEISTNIYNLTKHIKLSDMNNLEMEMVLQYLADNKKA